MKKLLVLFLLAACGVLLSAKQVTIIGPPGILKLDSYPVKVNKFEIGSKEKLTETRILRICESLDNSKFVFFPQYPKRNTALELFRNPSICRSLKGVLERKGIILFGTADWSSIAGRPSFMTKFFTGVGVKLFSAKNYLDTAPKGKPETSVAGAIVPEFSKSIFTKPNKPGNFLAIRHFGDISATSFVPFIKTSDGRITGIIQENVCGGGKIIFTYNYNIIRKTESPFIENILTALYGSMRKVSRREKLRQKNAPAAAAVKAVDLSKPVSLELVLSKTGAKPRNTTKVKISGNRDKMIVEFFCKQKAPLTANVTRRDDNVWNDDCVEVAIANSMKRDARLFQFIVNTNNAVYDAQNANSSWNCKNFKSSVKKNGNDFYVRMEIPVKEFKLDKFFRMNVGREQISDKEITSWDLAPNGFAHLPTLKTASYTPNATFTVAGAKTGGKLQIMQVPVFTRIYPDSEPLKGAGELKDIRITLPRNDLELTQIVFYNTTEESYIFRIEPELRSPNGDIFSFSELFNWRAPTGEVFSEIETPLNHANIITVPSGENKVLLLKAKTMRAPGNYKWSFEIVPVNVKMPKRKINVTANVLSLAIDQKKLPHAYGFGPYNFSWANRPGYRDRYWLQLKDYHFTHVQAPEPYRAIIASKGKITVSDDPKLYINAEAFLMANVPGWHYGYGVIARFTDKIREAGLKKEFRDPEILKLFDRWCANWAKALRAAKVDFSRFTVPMKDEPRTAALPDLIAAAKILRKYGFRLNSTLATWTTIDDIKTLAPYLHTAIPWEPLVTSRSMAPEARKLFKKHCARIMPYLCSVSGDFSPLQSYFRFRGIRTYMLDGDDISLWAVNSWRGNDYRSEENKDVNGSFLIHHGDARGFVPTFRLEAFREAVEDLYYLKLAAKSSDPAVKALIAPAKLEAIMTQDDPAVTAAWHEALLKALSKKR